MGRDNVHVPAIGKGQGQRKNLCVHRDFICVLLSSFVSCSCAFCNMTLLRRTMVATSLDFSQDPESAWRRRIFVRLPVSG